MLEISKINRIQRFNFHDDIFPFLYFADSALKNYEYSDICKNLNIQIISGNLNSGFNIYGNEEPSALYCFFSVYKPIKNSIGKVPSFPRYRALNPYQRYEYLEFLENPYIGNPDKNYLILLLYCLERRLSEGKIEVLHVMCKLADYHPIIKPYVQRTLRRYDLWKSGKLLPENCRVYWNYTLFVGCHDSTLTV